MIGREPLIYAVIGRESLVSETGFVIGRSRLLTFLVFLVSPVRLVACDFSLGFSEFKVLDLWFELAPADKLLLGRPSLGLSASTAPSLMWAIFAELQWYVDKRKSPFFFLPSITVIVDLEGRE